MWAEKDGLAYFSAPLHSTRDKSWPWQRCFVFLQRVFQAEGFRNASFFGGQNFIEQRDTVWFTVREMMS